MWPGVRRAGLRQSPGADAGPPACAARRLDRWLTVNLPGSVAESTEDGYVNTVHLHLIPALGRKRLTKLTVADLDRLWKAKRDAGYSSNSVRIMRTVLRRALGQAVRLWTGRLARYG
jgi:hypothetical protein